MLARVFPADLIDYEVVAGAAVVKCGAGSCRPGWWSASCSRCACSGQLHYEEVVRLLPEGLRGWNVSCTAAISRARARLGPEPLRALFGRVCRPVAGADAVGAGHRQWRLVTVDGTALKVPDTTVNAEYFGRTLSDRGAGSSPQVRMVALSLADLCLC
ncbi:transposase domain-containing protein [Streptomyces vinaceus]